MCEIIIDGKTVEFESSVLTQYDLQPHQDRARHIKICNSVKEIRDTAFYGFRRLENIEISDSVKVIGEGAFMCCSVLKTVAFPNSIIELRNGICMDCKSLENVIIPDSVTKIDDGAFWGCKSLKSISLPDSITYMGNRVFYGCDAIRLKINESRELLPLQALSGYIGQLVTIDINGDEYSLLTCSNSGKEYKVMVITGYVDYADRKLYSGYEFNGEIDPQNKKLFYCCYKDNQHLFHDATMDGLKRKLDFFNIR